MKVMFWGTRGSIPTPSTKHHKTEVFGGNTTCVLVESRAGGRLVIDAGSGLRLYGLNRLSKGEFSGTTNLLISHVHWDHIQGLPFYPMVYIPGNKINVWGNGRYLENGISKLMVERAIQIQQSPGVFPVYFEELQAEFEFNDVTRLMDAPVEIEGMRVSALLLNHPRVGSYSYKIEADGKTLVCVWDHEHDPDLSGEGEWDLKVMKWMEGADLVIHDAQYTPEEYDPEQVGKQGMKKVGWGHSVDEKVVRLVAKAGVERLILTHHEPTHDDEFMLKRLAYLTEMGLDLGVQVAYAMEGSTWDLDSPMHLLLEMIA